MSNPVVQPSSGLSFGWWEYISRTGSTQEASWRNDGSSVKMMIDISWADRSKAVKEILGFPKRVGTSLQRQLPWRHPYWDWLYAMEITDMRGVDWFSKGTFEHGPTSTYGLERLTIQFNAPPYEVLADDQIDGEFDRFIIKQTRPTVEFAATPTGTFEFAAGTPHAGTPFTGSTGYKLSQSTISWEWVAVPHNFIFDNDDVAINIEAALGTVNSVTFAGRRPGTMLFESVEFKPVMAPVDPSVLGYTDIFLHIPRIWNVALNWKYFNPPTNDALGKFGHLLAPDVADANGLWYYVTTQQGRPIYQSTDHAKIFQAI